MGKQKTITSTIVNGHGKSSVAVIQFNTNSLTNETFNELNAVLSDIEGLQEMNDPSNKLEGVIFTSEKDKIFLAGADLFELSKIMEMGSPWREPLLRDVIGRGQSTFERIEKLNIPTVAAIHGMCLGGGLELALACDYRITSNDSKTKLGLPEVTLGILPAWGGTTRLPELLTLPNALTALLTGKLYAPKPALKVGLIDKIVHRENLVSTSLSIIRKETRLKRKPQRSFIPPFIVFNQAAKNVKKATNGNYPAPNKIIETVKECRSLARKDCFRREVDVFIELTNTPEMANLLRIFRLQEESKKLKFASIHTKPIKKAVVVGAGTMGAGIAQWISSRGVNVLLKDVNEDAVSAGLKKIGDLYVQGVRKHKFDRPAARDGLARVSTSIGNTPLHTSDLVIEAIVEKLDVKQKVLSQLEEKLSDDAIIATNTSALSIDDMASCLKRPERFVGIHFFNPVHQMKLVEIVRGSKTSDETVQRAVQFVQKIGKLPVVVKDSPGFVVNRVLLPYLVQAAGKLNDGFSAESIDKAMIGFGMPMGPFRLMDEIGLDVCYHVAKDLEARLKIKGDGIDVLKSILDDGHLGKKTGKGFYKYKNGKAVRNQATEDAAHVATLLVNTMVEESWKILDDGVVDDRKWIDFSMIMGTGWAPFRGGPCTHDTDPITSLTYQKL